MPHGPCFKNGQPMPKIGLGTWEVTSAKDIASIYDALKSGYRHIDCAFIYNNEEQIGPILQKAFKEGIVSRDELWITSKLWCDRHRKEDVKSALQNTLKNLQIDYLNLYLMHWPIAMKQNERFPQSADKFISLEEIPLEETWVGMHDAMKSGLCQHIGVSNFSVKKLNHIIEKTNIIPKVNQVERHPFLQQQTLMTFCQQKDIHITGYCPVGRYDANLLNHPVIQEIATAHHCTPIQVILSWGMSEYSSVIPKSVNPQHQKENLATVTIHLSQEERQKMASLDKHHRYIQGTSWTIEGSPYTQETLWDEGV